MSFLMFYQIIIHAHTSLLHHFFACTVPAGISHNLTPFLLHCSKRTIQPIGSSYYLLHSSPHAFLSIKQTCFILFYIIQNCYITLFSNKQFILVEIYHQGYNKYNNHKSNQVLVKIQDRFTTCHYSKTVYKPRVSFIKIRERHLVVRFYCGH